MNNNAKHLSIAGLLTLATTVVVYFLITADINGIGLLPRPTAASEEATFIEPLFHGHFMVMAFLFAIIVVPMVYAIVVFRRRPGDESDAPHIHGNTTVEIIWTIAPLILVVGFAIWGVQAYTTLLAAEPNEIVIRGQGYKWDWNFYYPTLENRVSPSLVVKVGEPVHMELQSRDIIHAFWVPEFRVKQDVVPFNTQDPHQDFGNEEYDDSPDGYTPTEIRFTPTKEGVYRVRCAEICGTNHYAMLAHVHVLSAADYDAWVSGELILPSDPNQTNAQPLNLDGSVNDVYYLPELEQYCQDKYGNQDDSGNVLCYGK